MRRFLRLLRTTFRLNQIGYLFYLLINLILLLGTLYVILLAAGIATPLTLGIAAVVYLALVSLLGEGIIRLMFGAGQVVLGNTTDSVSLAFMEAYRDAARLDPDISQNIRLYICRESFPDAFAFGRNTILITESAARLSQNDLKILLLEKFAQISDNDSNRILLLIEGNLLFIIFVFLIKTAIYAGVAIVGFFLSLFRFVLSIFTPLRSGGGGMFAFSAYLNVCHIISNGAERVLLFFFNLFIRLALLSIRSSYYINDAFICRCGYAMELRYFLEFVAADVTGFQSTLGTISSAKPSRLSRLSRVQTEREVVQSTPIIPGGNGNTVFPEGPNFPALGNTPPANGMHPVAETAGASGFHVIRVTPGNEAPQTTNALSDPNGSYTQEAPVVPDGKTCNFTIIRKKP